MDQFTFDEDRIKAQDVLAQRDKVRLEISRAIARLEEERRQALQASTDQSTKQPPQINPKKDVLMGPEDPVNDEVVSIFETDSILRYYGKRIAEKGFDWTEDGQMLLLFTIQLNRKIPYKTSASVRRDWLLISLLAAREHFMWDHPKQTPEEEESMFRAFLSLFLGIIDVEWIKAHSTPQSRP